MENSYGPVRATALAGYAMTMMTSRCVLVIMAIVATHPILASVPHILADPLIPFLADRTNGRAYATVLRLSSSSVVCLSVCDVMYCV